MNGFKEPGASLINLEMFCWNKGLVGLDNFYKQFSSKDCVYRFTAWIGF